jgi:hypothetical protein
MYFKSPRLPPGDQTLFLLQISSINMYKEKSLFIFRSKLLSQGNTVKVNVVLPNSKAVSTHRYHCSTYSGLMAVMLKVVII